MRIISDFHDYYDCIQALGQDQNLVYVRSKTFVAYKMSVVNFWGRVNTEWPFPLFVGAIRTWGEKPALSVRAHVVGFCGTIYPALVLVLTTNKGQTTEYCYDIESVDKFINGNLDHKGVEAYHLKRPTRRYKGWKFGKNWPHKLLPEHCRRELFVKWFEAVNGVKSNFLDLFIRDRIPLFIANENLGEITLNARLSDMEFYKVFSPQLAFQEIEMFLGGLAIDQKPLPIIPDKVMAGAKGFDEWSFKKEPSRRK